MNCSNLGQGSETISTSASSHFGLLCGLAITSKLSHLADQYHFAIANLAVRSAFEVIRLLWAGSRTFPAKAASSRFLSEPKLQGSLRLLFPRIGQAPICLHSRLDMNAGCLGVPEFHQLLDREFDFTDIRSVFETVLVECAFLAHHRNL